MSPVFILGIFLTEGSEFHPSNLQFTPTDAKLCSKSFFRTGQWITITKTFQGTINKGNYSLLSCQKQFKCLKCTKIHLRPYSAQTRFEILCAHPDPLEAICQAILHFLCSCYLFTFLLSSQFCWHIRLKSTAAYFFDPPFIRCRSIRVRGPCTSRRRIVVQT